MSREYDWMASLVAGEPVELQDQNCVPNTVVERDLDALDQLVQDLELEQLVQELQDLERAGVSDNDAPASQPSSAKGSQLEHFTDSVLRQGPVGAGLSSEPTYGSPAPSRGPAGRILGGSIAKSGPIVRLGLDWSRMGPTGGGASAGA